MVSLGTLALTVPNLVPLLPKSMQYSAPADRQANPE